MNYSEILASISDKVEFSNYLIKENREEIISEILTGLSANQKYISSRFFYNETGSSLFEEITSLPEYYPTRTEQSILRKAASEILADAYNPCFVELGSGDCSKISILFDALDGKERKVIDYYPVDVSKTAIIKSAELLSRRYTRIRIHGLRADFMKHLDVLPGEGNRVICFFGSTLGNFTREQGKVYIREIKDLMRPGDSFLLGLDMVKDIRVLEAAYNDRQGVTEAFNKNILSVINHVAGTNFVPDSFEHMAFYNRDEARIEMHLLASRNITITSPYFQKEIILKKGESIHTENSHKFTPEHITQLARFSGLDIKDIYSDQHGWFSLVQFILPKEYAPWSNN